MTPLVFLAVALAGGLGAVLRLLVDDAVKARVRSDVPWGILLINLSGSFALGFVTAATIGSSSAIVLQIVGIGLLGGYTTFSTASVDTVRLIGRRRIAASLIAGPGMLIAAVAAAALGWALATLLP